MASLGLAVVLTAASVGAQSPGDNPPTERLPFSRPESWVLASFTSATLLSGLEMPVQRKAGTVTVGFELGWLPPFDAEQRRVGFNGVEDEDLNKVPVLLRPRVSVGLPGKFSVIVAGIPPVPLFGVKAALLSAGIERPVVLLRDWTIGVRGYGQIGSVRSDYTCPAAVASAEPGSADNPEGCQAPSSDTAKLRYAGAEASVAYRSGSERGLSPHAAIGINYIDVEFHVDALTFGFRDRTSYASRGVTVSTSAGVTYRFTPRLAVSGDVFYSPLTVRRRPEAPLIVDGFFNVRALVTYSFR